MNKTVKAALVKIYMSGKIQKSIRRANKLKKYYEDEYSFALIEAREKNYVRENPIIFMETILKYAAMNDDEKQFVLMDDFLPTTDFLTIVYKDSDYKYVEYTKMLLSHTRYKNQYVLMDLEEYKVTEKVGENTQIVPVIEYSDIKEFLRTAYERNEIEKIYIPEKPYLLGTYGTQYLDVFEPIENEIIVNAGCYDCATDIEMIRWGGGRVKRIYAFEPDKENIEVCKNVIKNNQLESIIELVPKGTWDINTTMNISTGVPGSGKVGDSGDEIDVTRIDDVVGNDKVSFIKMDIEGAELRSLKGAANTIRSNHPRLAICIYHKVEDIYEIPEYILSLVPEYRFYVRHYNSNKWETVLYAECR